MGRRLSRRSNGPVVLRGGDELQMVLASQAVTEQEMDGKIIWRKRRKDGRAEGRINDRMEGLIDARIVEWVGGGRKKGEGKHLGWREGWEEEGWKEG